MRVLASILGVLLFLPGLCVMFSGNWFLIVLGVIMVIAGLVLGTWSSLPKKKK
jgi:hypothetical protein